MAVKKPQLPKGLLEYSEEQIIKKLIEWTQLDAKGMQSFVNDLLATVNIPVVTSAPVEVVAHPPLMKLMDNGVDARRLYVYFEDNWSYVELIGGGGEPSDDAFGLIAVAGQDSVEADSSHDTLTLVASEDITILTDNVADSVTIRVSEGNMTHSHDNVYYTEGEVDGFLATKISHSLADAANDFLVASGDDTFVKKTLAETGAILEGDLDHGNIQGLGDDDHTQYILHSLADAANDFLVASGDNTFVKKTLAEVGAILEADIDHDNLVNYDAAKHFIEGSIDHGSIAGLDDNDHTQYILHSLAAAANDFIVASGANTFVKKTLAETGAILEADISHDNLVDYDAAEHFIEGSIDHGSIAGLGDDDHDKYPLVTNFEADRATLVTAWDDLTDGGLCEAHYHNNATYLDHGDLIGLGDDDHTQYVLVTDLEVNRATVNSYWEDLTDGGDTELHSHAGGAVDTAGVPEALDFARFTDVNTIEGRSYAETKADLSLEIGTDVLAQQTIGIADNNLLEVDDADAADNDYAKFTASGLEGRSASEVRTDLGLATTDNVVFASVTCGDTKIGDHGIQLDMVPDADGEWCGSYVDVTVDANSIGFGGAMHMDTDSHWINSDADTVAGMPCLGISVEAGTGTRKVLVHGFVKKTAWAWTPGAILFASATVGLFTHTAPAGVGDQVQSIGIAIDADTIFFNPSTVLVERD